MCSFDPPWVELALRAMAIAAAIAVIACFLPSRRPWWLLLLIPPAVAIGAAITTVSWVSMTFVDADINDCQWTNVGVGRDWHAIAIGLLWGAIPFFGRKPKQPIEVAPRA